jgi:hypothetical protein
MLILDDSGSLVQVVTSSTANLDVCANGVDHTTATDAFAAFVQNTLISTAVTTTVVATPASGKIRNVKGLHFRNKHASTAQTIIVQHTDGTTTVELFKVTLQAGEEAVMNDAGVWFVYDANGGVKMGASAASDTLAGLIMIASVAEMEADTDVTKAVVSGRLDRHPAALKAWLSCGVAADLQQSFNITSLTDTGTGVVTVTIATDFAAANYCAMVSVEATGTTWAVANARECHDRSATRAAGSVAYDCIDNTATTCLVKDPTTWHVALIGDQP